MIATRDPEVLSRFLNLEHVGDIVLLPTPGPTLKPPLPARRAVEHQHVYRWGITLGQPQASEISKNSS
jgi:hypothetical protein